MKILFLFKRPHKFSQLCLPIKPATMSTFWKHNRLVSCNRSSRWLCLKTRLAYLPLNIGVHFRRVATEGPSSFRLYVSVYIFRSFFMFSHFHWFDPHHEDCVALANLLGRISKNRIYLHSLDHGHSNSMLVDFLTKWTGPPSPIIETCSLPKCGIGILIRRRKKNPQRRNPTKSVSFDDICSLMLN